MTFENELSALNDWHFFREFTYSETTFHRNPSNEVELADNIVWIEPILMVYQLKERKAPSNTSPLAEKKWFDSKVLGKLYGK